MKNNKVGVAVLGLGRVGITHIDAILNNDDKSELTAVIDAQEELAARVSKQFDVPYYTSLEAGLQDDNIDAIVICLPHDQHAPMAIQATNAKRHVLTEKVMATSLREAEKMVRAAEANNVKLMVGQSRRFITHLQEAKRRLSEIGPVTSLLYTFACRFDYETAPVWWRSEAKTGGLVYPMLGSHSIDFSLWIRENCRPISVFASGRNSGRGFEGHDTATIIINFEDGTHATNYLTINNKPTRHEALITGVNGSIYFTHGKDHEGLIGVPTTDLFLNGQLIMSGDSERHAFAVQMDEFVTSILKDRQPEASGQEILLQIRLIEAAMTSAREGRLIPIEDK